MSMTSALEKRRSIYALGTYMPVSDDEAVHLIEEATRLVPDAFNMKSQRVVVALNERNTALWDAIYDAFGGKVARDKIDSFAAGCGTVLYFIDTSVVEGLQEQFPLYAANFPVWAQQANGMLQMVVWTSLAEVGVGANLQHYNPVIDDAVLDLFDLPKSWQLIAQMPFGGIVEGREAKKPEDISLRVRVER